MRMLEYIWFPDMKVYTAATGPSLPIRIIQLLPDITGASNPNEPEGAIDVE